MPSIRLLVSAATPHGKMLTESVSALEEAKQKIDRIRGMMEMAVRSPVALVDADFEPLCLELGIPYPAKVQTAKDLFYLLATVKTKLEAAEVVEFMKQCDQG